MLAGIALRHESYFPHTLSSDKQAELAYASRLKDQQEELAIQTKSFQMYAGNLEFSGELTGGISDAIIHEDKDSYRKRRRSSVDKHSEASR
jgi:hypothetical protein